MGEQTIYTDDDGYLYVEVNNNRFYSGIPRCDPKTCNYQICYSIPGGYVCVDILDPRTGQPIKCC